MKRDILLLGSSQEPTTLPDVNKLDIVDCNADEDEDDIDTEESYAEFNRYVDAIEDDIQGKTHELGPAAGLSTADNKDNDGVEARYGRHLDGRPVRRYKNSTRPLQCDPTIWTWLGAHRQLMLKEHLKSLGKYKEASDQDRFESAVADVEKQAAEKKAALAVQFGVANEEETNASAGAIAMAAKKSTPSAFIEYGCATDSAVARPCKIRGVNITLLLRRTLTMKQQPV